MSTAISNRDRVLAALRGEVIDYIPSWTMSFFNVQTIRRLMPAGLLVPDVGMWPEEDTYGFAAHPPEELDRLIAFNRFIDRVAVGVGQGANHAFGHGGPGEFNARVVSDAPNETILEYETGAKARVCHQPHFYHIFDLPVRTADDLERVPLPDPDAPERWQGFRADVAYLKAQGEYTVGWVNGFFSGCHYFFCDYQELLMNLLLNPELVTAILRRLGDWNLRAARQMCEAGIDCVGLVEDMGTAQNLLFRPAIYDKLLFPWHRALCDLVHGYGAHVHMHSHGNINKILDRIVDTGIDMLNPLDPTEGMDLRAVKERFGDRLTLVGGMDKLIFDQEPEEIEARLQRSIDIAGRDGRFILMDPCGIPETLSREKFLQFLQISRRVRGQREDKG